MSKGSIGFVSVWESRRGIDFNWVILQLMGHTPNSNSRNFCPGGLNTDLFFRTVPSPKTVSKFFGFVKDTIPGVAGVAVEKGQAAWSCGGVTLRKGVFALELSAISFQFSAKRREPGRRKEQAIRSFEEFGAQAIDALPKLPPNVYTNVLPPAPSVDIPMTVGHRTPLPLGRDAPGSMGAPAVP